MSIPLEGSGFCALLSLLIRAVGLRNLIIVHWSCCCCCCRLCSMAAPPHCSRFMILSLFYSSLSFIQLNCLPSQFSSLIAECVSVCVSSTRSILSLSFAHFLLFSFCTKVFAIRERGGGGALLWSLNEKTATIAGPGLEMIPNRKLSPKTPSFCLFYWAVR